MALKDIVNVIITKSTRSLSRVGFGTGLIAGINANVDNRVEIFTDPTAAKAKVTGASSIELAMIDDYFAQNPAPTQLFLGAVAADRIATLTGTMTAGTITATVNGTVFSQAFTVDNDTTMAALLVLIEADADVDASSTYAANVFTLTPITLKSLGASFDISLATGLTAVVITSAALTPTPEEYDAALDAVLLANPGFYGVTVDSRLLADQERVADWTETNKKFYAAVSADANIVDQTKTGDTTSIAEHAQSNALERTAVFYHSKAATEGMDAAFLGAILSQDPGTYTAKFQTLASISVDTLTPTQEANAVSKKANVYLEVGGANIVLEGTVGAAEFIDIIIMIDWLQANMQADVFATLANAPKVPFTDPGIAVIQAAMTISLTTLQNRGGISPEIFDAQGVQKGGFFITVPALVDVPTADKAARTLKEVKFTAYVAGAIHATVINGIVTV